MNHFLPYGRQTVDESDVELVIEVLNSSYLTSGPLVEEFERELADSVGAKYAVACSSGTAALHLAVLAADLDETRGVIVPTMTFLSSANAARFLKAPVWFADVDSDHGLLTRETLRDAMARADSSVGAVIPVHLNGQSVDMIAIKNLVGDSGIKIIEDASHALGSRLVLPDGRVQPVGSCSHSDMCVFSFHAVKTIAMGEGGAVTTNDEILYQRLVDFRNHGIIRTPERFKNTELAFSDTCMLNPWYYEMHELGFNYRVTDIQCALGLSQLRKLENFVERRRQLVERYDEQVRCISPEINPIKRLQHTETCWHLYVLLIDFSSLDISRAVLMKKLQERKIGTQVHYIPVHWQPYYRRHVGEIDLPGAATYYQRILSLPLYPSMVDADVDRVVSSLRELICC